MTNDLPPLDDLTRVLERLSIAGHQYSLVLQSPDGGVQFLSSTPQTPETISALRQTLSQTPLQTKYRRALDAPTLKLAPTNKRQVESHIRMLFRELQQVPCKSVCKAWIKYIEPKKQTRHPYKLGDESKPPWWPVDVRHTEPDHLNMKERLSVMVDIVLNCGRVDELWNVCRALDLKEYQLALVQEVISVAEAYRVKSAEIEVSDFERCDKNRRERGQWFRERAVELKVESPVSEKVEEYVNPVVSFHEDLRRNSTIGSLALR